MRYLIVMLALLPLAGCSSPEEVAKREEQREIAACLKAGYEAGTPAFEDCRMQVKAVIDQQKADRITASDNIGQSSSSRGGMPMPSTGNTVSY